MKKSIKFNNYLPHVNKSGETVPPVGGTFMYVDDIDDIICKESTEKRERPYLQVFNSGYRVTNENIDWNTWNGCVFNDIDSKHYYENVKQFDTQKLFDALYSYLSGRFERNFYALQQSHSGTSYHIIWYFDVEKNEENFDKCHKLAKKYLKETFKAIGAEEILKYKGVIDNCAKSKCQGIYWTNKYKKNDYEWDDFGKNDEIKDVRPEIKRIKLEDPNTTYSFENINYTEPDNVEYIDHIQRMRLFKSLSRLFKGEVLKNEWIKCAQKIPENNGHTTRFYIKAPYINDWNAKLNGNEYCDTKLLAKFGYTVKINENKITKDEALEMLINLLK